MPLTGHVDRNLEYLVHALTDAAVVPLTGHVDRNASNIADKSCNNSSCPSRGTWIEIRFINVTFDVTAVVPLTGHVDRNILLTALTAMYMSRAPHGARG